MNTLRQQLSQEDKMKQRMEKEGVKLQAAQLAFYQGQGQHQQAQGRPQNGGYRYINKK